MGGGNEDRRRGPRASGWLITSDAAGRRFLRQWSVLFAEFVPWNSDQYGKEPLIIYILLLSYNCDAPCILGVRATVNIS